MTDPPVVTAAALQAAVLALHTGTAGGDPDCGCGSGDEHAELLEGDRTLAEVILDAAAPHLAYAAGGAAGDRIRALETRIGVLQQLAGDVLGSYYKASDGYRGRVGQVQLARWQAVLDGQPPP